MNEFKIKRSVTIVDGEVTSDFFTLTKAPSSLMWGSTSHVTFTVADVDRLKKLFSELDICANGYTK